MTKYDADSIQILDDLEHVRLRPHMYIGDVGIRGYHHLLREVIDNVIDEYLAGRATSLFVSLDTQTQVAIVRDDGPGIPVSKHKKAGISTLTAVFTSLFAGGKFNKEAYTGGVIGLHGIGLTAVTALSQRLQVWTVRKKKTWTQTFSRGKTTSEVERAAKDVKLASGTVVKFQPDTQIFKKVKWKAAVVAHWLKTTAYLCPGLKIRFKVDDEVTDYHAQDGLVAMLTEGMANCTQLHEPLVLHTDDFDLLFCWTDIEGEHWRSFVNVAETPKHGTHLDGVKKALQDVLNEGQEPRHRGEDLRDGILGIIHAKVLQPQFQGQTKARLENTEVEQSVYEAVTKYLQRYAIENPEIIKAVLVRTKQLRDAKVQFRAQQKAIKGTKVKKGARGLLPGKLTEAPDCSPQERELFLVEGDGAGGTVIKARVTKKGNRHYQEVFPLRGKLLNAARKGGVEELVKNEEIKNLFKIIGTGIGESFDLAKCRYNNIYLLMDADPDGKHIISLLLSLFAKHLPELIQEDVLRVVDNPLFMGVSAKRRFYGATVDEVKQQFSNGEKVQIRRFKGLGESNPEDLRIYAMDPKTRKCTRVLWGGERDRSLVLAYMGKDTGARKEILGITD